MQIASKIHAFVAWIFKGSPTASYLSDLIKAHLWGAHLQGLFPSERESLCYLFARSLTGIDRLHLPRSDFGNCSGAIADELDAQLVLAVIVGCDHGLSVIGEHFDHILIDEDPQGGCFARLEFKWSVDGPHAKRLLSGIHPNRKTGLAFDITTNVQAKLFCRVWREGDLQLPRVTDCAIQGLRHAASQRDVSMHVRGVSKRFEFPQWLDSQDSVLWEAEFTRKGLNCGLGGGDVAPSPHDASAIGSEDAFGGEAVPAVPIHSGVEFGIELLVLPLAEVVAAAEGVADAEEHPLVADAEEVGAGDVFGGLDIGHVVGEEAAEVVPVLEVGRFEEGWRFSAAGRSAGKRVVNAVIDPGVGVPVGDEACILSGLDTWNDRHRLGPLFEVVALGDLNLVSARALAVIDDGGLAFFGEESGAAEHSVACCSCREGGGMPLPVDHVFAGDVGK